MLIDMIDLPDHSDVGCCLCMGRAVLRLFFWTRRRILFYDVCLRHTSTLTFWLLTTLSVQVSCLPTLLAIDSMTSKDYSNVKHSSSAPGPALDSLTDKEPTHVEHTGTTTGTYTAATGHKQPDPPPADTRSRKHRTDGRRGCDDALGVDPR